MNQECKHCKLPIITTKSRKLNFCSRKECQKSRRVLACKKTYLKHREKRLVYAKKYQKELWRLLKIALNCEICQKQFNYQPRSSNAKTCSTECSIQLRKRTIKRINEVQFKKTNHNGPCCFEAFTHLNTPHCDFCSKLFKREAISQKFCSPECRKQKYLSRSELRKTMYNLTILPLLEQYNYEPPK